MFVYFFWHAMERQVIIKGIAKKVLQPFLIVILTQDLMEVN
jgi:hypothetical protein